jgi:hypothetical protein
MIDITPQCMNEKLCVHDLKMYDLKVKSIIYCGYLGYIVSACALWSYLLNYTMAHLSH